MFNKFKIILILFFLNVFNFSYAAEKIAYIDIDFLLNDSGIIN